MSTCSQCTFFDVPFNGMSCKTSGVLPQDKSCSQFRDLGKDVTQTKKAFIEANEPVDAPWLPSNFSKAFMVVIGAGPWKFNRRKKVQQDALTWLGSREIEDIQGPVNCYPLEWQNRTVKTLSNNLRFKRITMENLCVTLIRQSITDSAEARRYFYTLCGNPKGFKVLSLFCRDSLKIDSFPIDRHVAKRLSLYELPKDENSMVHLCEKSNLNVRDVAISFVQSGDGTRGLNLGNPDWSSY